MGLNLPDPGNVTTCVIAITGLIGIPTLFGTIVSAGGLAKLRRFIAQQQEAENLQLAATLKAAVGSPGAPEAAGLVDVMARAAELNRQRVALQNALTRVVRGLLGVGVLAGGVFLTDELWPSPAEPVAALATLWAGSLLWAVWHAWPLAVFVLEHGLPDPAAPSPTPTSPALPNSSVPALPAPQVSPTPAQGTAGADPGSTVPPRTSV